MAAGAGTVDPVTTVAALDEARVRADFPILDREIRGCRLAYLDTAATAQKPRVVIDAVADFYRATNANVHRGVHVLSEEATEAYDRSRDRVRRFLNAAAAEEIIFTGGTTAGINLVAQSWGRSTLAAGDEIVLTTLEHHSNIVPWQLIAHEKGAVLRVVPLLADGSVDLDGYRSLLGPRTRMVALSHTSNVLGTVLPVAEMVGLAHQVGALVLVDGAQSVPHFPVDVQALGCDFLVFSGHKLYGPTGIGALYGRRELLEKMDPWQGGGGMIERVTWEATTWAPPPARFEAGTPPIAETVGLAAAIDYLEALGMESIAAHERDLVGYLSTRLDAVPGLTVYGRAPGRIGVASFLLDDVHPHDLATVLDTEGVAVRAGHHCAQPLMEHLGVNATVRASLGIYSTRTDVDQLVSGIEAARKRFAR
ncbi:MAG: cysteine desulfurase [Gemmatimonadota bacterium]